ncbi:DUF192 domain-containing protein [Pseudooceanicola sediminis]|uniref:DUF192 domain-containing protein n=2 Tax=Pseudooceanicola sediminis TaxID=2211117 RepID=A0A399J3B2_9RHOB|nr:DUF192 domain-containing protein [Puniceibacterium sp. HSS470]RII39805.1 DUF192 domain-containing protein [Pseudooceanicola sediminis]|tara:strand:+ start:69550 stop:70053 length:504 start_codon:yes stop_codon:yes gene_type:complete
MRHLPIALASLCFGFVAPMAAVAASAQSCRQDSVELRGDWGSARFRVEIADDAAERSKGLMFREEMSSGAGMLFIYDRPQVASFWMRNTLIPLDMIFMNPAGEVTAIQRMAKPQDDTPLSGGANVLYVLEINGGLAERMGLDVGSQMRHPAIAPDLAAWRCDADAEE